LPDPAIAASNDLARRNGPYHRHSSSALGFPIHECMRSRGFLRVACALLAALGAASCRFEVRGTEPATKSEGEGWAVDVREAPAPKAPASGPAVAVPEGGICEPGSGPVMIVVVESPAKVKSASALWEATPILARDPETVVFADGRIVTSRVEAAGEQLQSLGWAHRDIEIVGGLPAAAGAWQRRSG
jgi:hypothetical protein